MTHPLAALIAGVKVKPLEWRGGYRPAASPELYQIWPDNGGSGAPDDPLENFDGFVLYSPHMTELGEYPTVEAAKAAAQADYEARVLAALEAAPVPDLTDSVTVHANMLRGTIAKPTVDQIIHLYGREAFQPMIDAAVAKALEDACLAVSEHVDWPEDEHGRTEQAGLFARVINAICAIAPAAPHVNETPKSEHDAGNVLTVPDLVEAGKVLEGVTPLVGWLRNPWSKSDSVERGPIPEWLTALLFEAAGKIEALSDLITSLIALATAQAAQIEGLTKERDDWRKLESAAKGLSEVLDQHETKGPLPDTALMFCWLAAQNVRAVLRGYMLEKTE